MRDRAWSRRESEQLETIGRIVSRGLVAVVVVAVLATGVVGSTTAGTTTGAGAGPPSTAETIVDAPPENVQLTVMVYPRSDFVVVEARYPARSSAEANRAENDTLDLGWFDGDDHVRRAFEARDERLGERIRFQTGVTDPSASISEFGDVLVEMRFRWTGAFEDGERELVLGPTLADHLPNGTTLDVRVPDDWTPVNATTETVEVGTTGRTDAYGWRIDGTEPEPRVTFNRSVFEDTTTPERSTPLGSAGGTVLALAGIAGGILLATGSRRE